MQQIVTVIVQLMFFLTPIIYPITIVPETWHGIPVRTIMAINPMAQFVEATRDVLYHLRVPTLGQTAMLLGWTLAAVLFARLVYVKLGPRVGESISPNTRCARGTCPRSSPSTPIGATR